MCVCVCECVGGGLPRLSGRYCGPRVVQTRSHVAQTEGAHVARAQVELDECHKSHLSSQPDCKRELMQLVACVARVCQTRIS